MSELIGACDIVETVDNAYRHEVKDRDPEVLEAMDASSFRAVEPSTEGIKRSIMVCQVAGCTATCWLSEDRTGFLETSSTVWNEEPITNESCLKLSSKD